MNNPLGSNMQTEFFAIKYKFSIVFPAPIIV